MTRRRWVIFGIVVLALALVWVWRSRVAGTAQVPQFRTATVTRGDIVVSVSGSGTIEPVSSVEVRSRATGRVLSVKTEEGAFVTKGQVLAEIDDTDARADLESARATLAGAQARLAQAQTSVSVQQSSNITQVRQSEANVAASRARLDQLLAGSRPEEIRQAEEGVRQARASLTLAEQNLARQEQLFAEGFISRAQLDQARSQTDVARSQLAAAEARLAQVKAGPTSQEIDIARAQLRQAEAALADARSGGLQERLRREEVAAARASVASALATLRRAEDRVAETRILAPITGAVVTRSVSIGQFVIGSSTGGTVVFTLADTSVVLARIFVDESDIARVTPQAQVRITADALPDETFSGRIARVAPQSVVVQNVRQYPVTVEVADPRRLLRLGMTVDAEFILASRTGVLIVPQEAVRGTESKAVFLVRGSALDTRVVTTGLSDGRFVEIKSGLQEGEIVFLGPARTTPSTGPTQQTNPFQPQFPRPQQQPRR
ncbi:MAG TPA: efflux RND transporter periplasmic adaptor subunit [bacterium]|nr:efflux RND transporter periplasmic adaptor subunit [bacterium]